MEEQRKVWGASADVVDWLRARGLPCDVDGHVTQGVAAGYAPRPCADLASVTEPVAFASFDEVKVALQDFQVELKAAVRDVLTLHAAIREGLQTDNKRLRDRVAELEAALHEGGLTFSDEGGRQFPARALRSGWAR